MKKAAVATVFLMTMLNFATTGIAVANAFELTPSQCSGPCADACAQFKKAADFGRCVGNCIEFCSS